MLQGDCKRVQTISENGHVLDLRAFHADLAKWGDEHRRVFPWRAASSPFHLLVAELMLRRTHARQVIGVYLTFIARYPDARKLAAAATEEVATTLYPLGLAWRVPAFQQMAQSLITKHDGEVPTTYEALTALPGVGDYVASALCCFAFGQAVSLVDTNTVRVVGRLFGLPTHAESRRSQLIRCR